MQDNLQISTISGALQWATAQLVKVSDLANLDAEILLAQVLQVARSHLYAWPQRKLTEPQQKNFLQLLRRRLLGEPIAYITGHREFWSLDLVVTPDVLIPRPETELLVELVLEKFSANEYRRVADIGTGSGAIALALAHERPQWDVHASDFQMSVLEVAKNNAQRLHIPNITFHQGHWCNALPNVCFDAIISNPPYIAEDDLELNQDIIEFEPHAALFSGAAGLWDIGEIINGAKNHLKSGGCLLIEHGYRQANAVKRLFAQNGYTEITLHQDMAGLDRVTTGYFS